MKHDRNGITVDIICKHPELYYNNCPTGKGNCAECRYCIAVLSAKDYFELENKVLSAITNEQENQVPTWIPCRERLPILGEHIKVHVLVTTSWGFVTAASYYGDHWDIDNIAYKITAVVAWMPLPEMYKGE